MLQNLAFRPLPGLASPHLQMILANFGPTGYAPPSESTHIQLDDGDKLCCEISTPPTWTPTHKTVAMVHGVGGSHLSSYMIRLARKFYQNNIRAVRINLRSAGTGKGLSKRPYHGGNSDDVWQVVQQLKVSHPLSPLSVIGFSLGGSLVIKMAAENGENAQRYLQRLVAVCPVLDFMQTVKTMSHRMNWVYHRYFLKKVLEQGQEWTGQKRISSLRSFDDQVTAPLWGYKDADDYYSQCGSCNFIPELQVPCDILLAADDPFIHPDVIRRTHIPRSTHVWITDRGSHVGFIGRSDNIAGPYWLDQQIFNWII